MGKQKITKTNKRDLHKNYGMRQNKLKKHIRMLHDTSNQYTNVLSI